ncbi:MAG: WbqC family protein [Cytophagia bacterium]|nr:WbqC family protein [Cytophagia bacterium]
MGKTIAITQSNYIPWKGYFDMISRCDVFVLYDTAQYTKRDWRNRNLIKTPEGLKWLTIPVKVKGQFYQSIRDTKVSDKSWAAKHWKTIEYCYKKTPYFDLYSSVVRDIYLSCDLEYLSDINLLFLKEICAILNIDTEFRFSKDFEIRGGRTGKLVNLCNDLEASKYITGPAAKGYIEEEAFSENGIELEWMNYSNYREYPQMYGQFEHAVSIIDLIFNTGPDSLKYLRREIE